MRLTAFFLFIGFLHVSATGLSQKITLSLKNAPLSRVFDEISKQAGVSVVYNEALMAMARPVSIDLRDATIQETLTQCLKDQPFSYKIENGMVIIQSQPISIPEPQSANNMASPGDIHGRITDSTGRPLEGATIQVKGTRRVATADENGEFTLKDVGPDDILVISFVGFGTRQVPAKGQKSVAITLHVTSADLANVEVAYSNGYQQIPKERATGSYDFIDNKLINREVTTNILDRLDGIANSVIFNHVANTVPNSQGTNLITIRGLSTLNPDEFGPLLILDGAPFYGDPTLINPNDVENITILKDAAAASIWGARAGNGVIVITTKKGHINQPLKIGVVSNISITGKPRIMNDPKFMDSNDFINLEEYLFSQGFYDANLTSTDYPVISPVVNLLNEANTGVISTQDATTQINALRNLDVRNDLLKYFFRDQVSQQYAINFSGGSDKASYYLSGGYDKTLSDYVGSQNDRLTFNSSSTFHPIKNLEIGVGFAYTQSDNLNNNSNIGSSYPFPYTQVVDSKGNPISIAQGYSTAFVQQAQQNGYLNWQFNPLQELRNGWNNTDTKGTDAKISTNLAYTFIPGLSVLFNYQYEKAGTDEDQLAKEQSYYTRNLINEYTNLGASNPYPIPIGDILISSTSGLISQAGRGQIDYTHNWRKHSLSAIAGGEITSLTTNSNTGNYLYGYNSALGISYPVDYFDLFPTAPSGGALQIPGGVPAITGTESRTVSAFSNASYSYDNRYTFSASVRKDASNLFGVNTNNKWKPLWSGGFKWQLSNERFYKSNDLPNLGLRITYGYSGNVDNNLPAVTTIEYLTGYLAALTNYTQANVNNPPNPNLKWENVGQINLALYFGSRKNRITGSVEYFKKYCTDLVAPVALDMTTGISSVTENSADINTRGMDIALTTKNIEGEFRWETTINFNYLTDKVTRYLGTGGTPTASTYVGASEGVNPIVGKTLEPVYAYKWGGLDSAGNPQGYLNGKLSENYTAIMADSISHLVFKGSAVPLFYGNVLNSFYWKRFSLSANIVFRLDYWFQKPTISYSGLLENITTGNGQSNIDYYKRWQKPGDEKYTTVPSFDYPVNPYRDEFYAGSEPNFLRGDNIRLQDIRLGYDLPNYHQRIIFKSFTVFVYSSNSLLLWRANKADIDPNYLAIPPPKTIAFGVNATF